VSTAASQLARDGCVERRPDGGWILHPDYAEEPASTERLMSRRPLLIDESDTATTFEIARRLHELQREAASLAAQLDGNGGAATAP